MEAVIREARPEDFEGVFGLLSELREHFRDEKPVDRESILSIFGRFIDNEEHHVYVAQADGMPVGLMTLSIGESLYDGTSYAVIDELVVSAAYRGRGIGGRLLTLAVELSRARGCLELCVDTTSSNEGAIRFYRDHGFKHENILFEMELDRDVDKE